MALAAHFAPMCVLTFNGYYNERFAFVASRNGFVVSAISTGAKLPQDRFLSERFARCASEPEE
jgi:hypothetical protein